MRKMWTQIFLIASLILFTDVPAVDAGKDWCDVLIIGSRAASFKRPLLSVDVSISVSATLRLHISETKQFQSSCPIGSL